MFELLKRLFTRKAKTLEEFIEAVKQEKCDLVDMRCQRDHKNGGESASVGFIGMLHYSLEFSAMGVNHPARKVFFKMPISERFGSERGLADASERRDESIKLFLYGEKNRKELSGRLTGVDVILVLSTGRVMDEQLSDKLHKDAATYNVSI